MLTLERMLHVFMRPAARAWYAAQLDQWSSIPHPSDSPVVRVDGDDPDRILLVGDGPAVGFGVVSHHLGLPGALARRLAHATGRGAEVRVAAQPRLIAESLAGELGRLPLRGVDAVVITTGVGDACRLTSVRAWQRDVVAAVDLIGARARRDTRVFWVGIPPIAAIPVIRGRTARIVQHHATLLNRRTELTLAGHPQAAFVPFDVGAHCDGERHRSATTFTQWAERIAPAMLTSLDMQARGTATK